jgi:glutathione S-transferase
MGLTASAPEPLGVDVDTFEKPSIRHTATLYYFAGRGVADQIRWMLAATEVSFTQKIINQRSQLQKMAERQLPFGQLPLLQIDEIEMVQSQAIIRYLARRGNLIGRDEEDLLTCDMIAEAVRDLLGLVVAAPFKRVAAQRKQQKQQQTPTLTNSSNNKNNNNNNTNTTSNKEQTKGTGTGNGKESLPLIPPAAVSPKNTNYNNNNNNNYSIDPSTPKTVVPVPPSVTNPKNNSNTAPPPLISNEEQVWAAHLALMKEKWIFCSNRFEAILRANNKKKLTALQAATPSVTPSVTPGNSEKNTNNNPSNPNKDEMEEEQFKRRSEEQQRVEQENDAAEPLVRLFLVGEQITYADILVAHVATWFVEECGVEIIQNTPLLVSLQNQIISLPAIRRFIRSQHYFPLGDENYVEQVQKVLGRQI